jgi:hypothetical protein
MNLESDKRLNIQLRLDFFNRPKRAPYRAFLYTRPSFMMTLKFLAGSAIRLMFSSGLPSTSSRSASAFS